MFRRITNILRLLLVILILLPLTVRSTLAPANQEEQVRAYTRDIEFDYVSWIFSALWSKISQGTLSVNHYLPPESQHKLVSRYLSLVKQESQAEDQISQVYTDPSVFQPEMQTASLRTNLQTIQGSLETIRTHRKVDSPVPG